MYRGLRLFGHPVHPALTDFPLALWAFVLLWDIIGASSGGGFWWPMSYWSIVIGLIVAAPTVLSGILDYFSIPTDHPAERTGIWHMAIMVSTTILYITNLLIRETWRVVAISYTWPIILSIIGLGLIIAGGWLGSTLVFRHGVGSEPTVEVITRRREVPAEPVLHEP